MVWISLTILLLLLHASTSYHHLRLEFLQVTKLSMKITTCFKCLFVPQSNYTVNFDPEIVVVGPDPETGILTQNFILTYAISSATELQLNKSLGQVDIRDPFETVQVGSYI